MLIRISFILIALGYTTYTVLLLNGVKIGLAEKLKNYYKIHLSNVHSGYRSVIGPEGPRSQHNTRPKTRLMHASCYYLYALEKCPRWKKNTTHFGSKHNIVSARHLLKTCWWRLWYSQLKIVSLTIQKKLYEKDIKGVIKRAFCTWV